MISLQTNRVLYHLNFKVSEKIIEENLLRLRQKTQS